MADTFSAVALDTLPKRIVSGRSFDTESANALLTLVSKDGQGASDGVAYPEANDARKAASRARRLLLHVAPDPSLVRSRVYTLDDGTSFRWTVSLGKLNGGGRRKAK